MCPELDTIHSYLPTYLPGVETTADRTESLIQHGWRIVEMPGGAFRLVTVQFKA